MPCPCERKSDFPSASAEGNSEQQHDLSFCFQLLVNVSAGSTVTVCRRPLKTEKGQIFISAQGPVLLTVPVCLPRPAVGWGGVSQPLAGTALTSTVRQGRQRCASVPRVVVLRALQQKLCVVSPL